jgi:hypothetical protein
MAEEIVSATSLSVCEAGRRKICTDRGGARFLQSDASRQCFIPPGPDNTIRPRNSALSDEEENNLLKDGTKGYRSPVVIPNELKPSFWAH